MKWLSHRYQEFDQVVSFNLNFEDLDDFTFDRCFQPRILFEKWIDGAVLWYCRCLSLFLIYLLVFFFKCVTSLCRAHRLIFNILRIIKFKIKSIVQWSIIIEKKTLSSLLLKCEATISPLKNINFNWVSVWVGCIHFINIHKNVAIWLLFTLFSLFFFHFS